MGSAVNNLPTLELLANHYPTSGAVLDTLASLRARLTLPRPLTHVISDIHGEHAKLRHVINNASGEMQTLVEEVFGQTLSAAEKSDLLAYLYYPVEKMEAARTLLASPEKRLPLVKKVLRQQFRLVSHLARQHTHQHLTSLIPKNHATLFLALLDEVTFDRNPAYADAMIEALSDYARDVHALHMASRLVRNLAIAEIIVAGDLADRGERVDRVIHFLKSQPRVEFTWGNHDVTWMGACLGSPILVATVLRISLRYLRLWQLEEGYGIILSPLRNLATTTYQDDPAEQFRPKRTGAFIDEDLVARMQKAIAIIELKLLGQLAERHPEWDFDDRRSLKQIDYQKNTITLEGVTYPLRDHLFPTIDPNDPEKLTVEEQHCLDRLRHSFVTSKRLWRHMLFLTKQGSLSLRRDHVLIFHACVPTNKDGSFKEAVLDGQRYAGADLFEVLEEKVQANFRQAAPENPDELDYFYWMWASSHSPLFGKDRMATFERYFLEEKETHKENKDPYFNYLHDANFCKKLGQEFGIEKEALIVNGHVPVKIEDGEDPVKDGGNAVTIDGAFSEAYGDHGYTLILRPGGVELAEHSHFESIPHFLSSQEDMTPKVRALATYETSRTVGDTFEGQGLLEQIQLLEQLLGAYRQGTIRERG